MQVWIHHRIDSWVKLSLTVSSLRWSQASRDPLVASTRHTCGALFPLPYCSLTINQKSRPHDMLNKKRIAEWLSCTLWNWQCPSEQSLTTDSTRSMRDQQPQKTLAMLAFRLAASRKLGRWMLNNLNDQSHQRGADTITSLLSR